MKFEIPEPLRLEHELLRAQLAKAAQESGELGEAARELARLAQPHFAREEEFALPPLALLTRVAVGVVTPEMAEVIPLTKRMRKELDKMLDEHRQISGVLEKVRAAAHTAGKPEYERFANAMLVHAQTEELILYPACILVGEVVKQALL